MTGTWREYTLDQACSLIADCPHSTPKWTESGVLVLRNTYIRNGRLDLSNPSFTDEENYKERIRRAVPQGGDLVISREAPMGEVAMIPDGLKACLGQRLVLLRPDQGICDGRFLLYAFLGGELRRQVLWHEGTGSTVSNLRIPLLKALKVRLPPIHEQRAIAHILGTLDDKIELNRRMNATLEAMARAIFKSWFVDFDPVRAKAEGHQPAGLDAATAALLPDGFEDSEFGEIPRGWRIAPIGESVRIVGGSTPSTKNPEYWDGGGIHWATPKDLSGLSDSVLLDTERKITEAGLAQISSGLLPAGTMLMSSRAPIGYLAISEVPVAINQGFIAMVCDGPLSNHYVLRWAQANMEEIKGRANGTTFMEISKANFRPMLAVVPPKHVMDAFDRIAGGLHRQIVANLEQSRTLSAQRDALLPKLLSGEIRVAA